MTKKGFGKLLVIPALLLLIAGLYFLNRLSVPEISAKAEALAEAVYPRGAEGKEIYLQDVKDYYKMTDAQRREIDRAFFAAVKYSQDLLEQYGGNGTAIEPFLERVMAATLNGAGGENALSAPLNLYFALAALSEAAAGETRQEILSALQAESIEELRDRSQKIWLANYYDDGIVRSSIGSSLWLRDDSDYRQEAVDAMAASYYASVYRGEMGSEEYDAAMMEWINGQTGGMLKESVSGLHLDPDDMTRLVTTLMFQDKWDAVFKAENNRQGAFHAPAGDTEATYMTQTDSYGRYFYGQKFGAYVKPLKSSGAEMVFLLPDEGVTVDELLKDEQAMRFMTALDGVPEVTIRVNLSLPKFDISADADLTEVARSLGIRKVFDPAVADLSGLSTAVQNVSAVVQGARCQVDEEGVRAAAYVLIPLAGAPAPPKDEIDFVLDRPFIFVLRSRDGLPLLAGVVNQPE